MKKKYLLFFVFLLSTSVFSQSKEYSVSLFSGVFFPGSYLDYRNLKTGSNLGIEFQHYVKPISFFAEVNYNFFGFDLPDSPDYFESTSPSSIIEINIGPRYIFGNGRFQPFIDAGAGLISEMYGSYNATYNNFNYNTGIKQRTNFDIGLGIGSVINIKDNFDFIIKARIYSFIIGGEGGIGIQNYYGIYGGIKYNF